jgi:hypothetical protein
MLLALGRRVSQLPVVIEERLILAWLAVGVAAPLVEAARGGIVPVDVDLEQLPPRCRVTASAAASNAEPRPRPRSSGAT